MEREDLLLAYGVNDDSEKLGFESISQKLTEPDYKFLAGKIAARLKGKKLLLFASFDMETAEEKQMPFEDFIYRKYKIACWKLSEPILGTKHYMNRRGAVIVEPDQLEHLIENICSFPYHMFAVISPEDFSTDTVNKLLDLWNGRALQPHVLSYCLPAVLENGAEFLHAVKKDGMLSLNCIYRD